MLTLFKNPFFLLISVSVQLSIKFALSAFITPNVSWYQVFTKRLSTIQFFDENKATFDNSLVTCSVTRFQQGSIKTELEIIAKNTRKFLQNIAKAICNLLNVVQAVFRIIDIFISAGTYFTSLLWFSQDWCFVERESGKSRPQKCWFDFVYPC